MSGDADRMVMLEDTPGPSTAERTYEIAQILRNNPETAKGKGQGKGQSKTRMSREVNRNSHQFPAFLFQKSPIKA